VQEARGLLHPSRVTGVFAEASCVQGLSLLPIYFELMSWYT